ncbi:MAG: hypothetical protein R3D05_21120 [Dongiaceae bacterium]
MAFPARAAYSMRLGDEAEAEHHSPMSEADNYIIEFTQVGANVKVTAIDPKTMTEVSIVGGTQYSQEFLTRQAVKKLQYVLSKRGEKGD